MSAETPQSGTWVWVPMGQLMQMVAAGDHPSLDVTQPDQASADWIADVVRDVAELPDRDSPTDWPDAMLVTADELRAVIERRTTIFSEADERLLEIECQYGQEIDRLRDEIKQHLINASGYEQDLRKMRGNLERYCVERNQARAEVERLQAALSERAATAADPCAPGCQMNTTGDPQNDCGTCALAATPDTAADPRRVRVGRGYRGCPPRFETDDVPRETSIAEASSDLGGAAGGGTSSHAGRVVPVKWEGNDGR